MDKISNIAFDVENTGEYLLSFYIDTTKQLKNETRGFGTRMKFKEKGRYIIIPEIATKENGIETNTLYGIKSIK